jgi:hypothetical protein
MSAPDSAAAKAPLLRLQAFDAEDLSLLSAHLQDALLRVCDLAYLPKQKRFVLGASRFDWAAEAEGRLERRQSALHFEWVSNVRYCGVARDRPDGVLELLTVTFEPGETPPEGRIRLIFSGGAAILLEVECLEAQLADLGPRWPVCSRPTHNLDEDAGAGS